MVASYQIIMYRLMHLKLYYCIMNSSQTKISEHNTHSHTKVQLLLIVGGFLTFHMDLFSSHGQITWSLSHFLIKNKLQIILKFCTHLVTHTHPVCMNIFIQIKYSYNRHTTNHPNDNSDCATS